ncbi:MAG: histidinol-phosphate transaminase [Xanthomonadales bacterium]|nr:histidinol-phosphate transaminase [Xanthomonadales bacterium]
MNVTALARPEIVAMQPYASARSEAPGQGVLLNANEAPRPLLTGLDSGPGLHRYPEPQPQELVARLAERYAVPRDCVLVTRGSDEGIDLLTRVFCRAGRDAVVQCPPTFGMYRIAACIQGADIVSVARDPARRFAMDEPAVLAAVARDDRVRLIFLTSPNNPTGDLVREDFLQKLLTAAAGRALVVLDEAYAEFCAQPSATRLIEAHENLVVLRTLSKAWASAGLRCGVVLAQPSVIGLLRRVIAPYPLATPIIALALRTLDDGMRERQARLIEEIARNKKALIELLENRTFVNELIAGEANFVLLRVNDARALLRYCADRGVILRGFATDPELQDCLRISVGSAADQAALAQALDAWENER